jgi:hypothetical protein
MDKTARQSTAFDNIQRANDPERKAEEFGEAKYSSPGEGWFKGRANKPPPPSSGLTKGSKKKLAKGLLSLDTVADHASKDIQTGSKYGEGKTKRGMKVTQQTFKKGRSLAVGTASGIKMAAVGKDITKYNPKTQKHEKHHVQGFTEKSLAGPTKGSHAYNAIIAAGSHSKKAVAYGKETSTSLKGGGSAYLEERTRPKIGKLDVPSATYSKPIAKKNELMVIKQEDTRLTNVQQKAPDVIYAKGTPPKNELMVIKQEDTRLINVQQKAPDVIYAKGTIGTKPPKEKSMFEGADLGREAGYSDSQIKKNDKSEQFAIDKQKRYDDEVAWRKLDREDMSIEQQHKHDEEESWKKEQLNKTKKDTYKLPRGRPPTAKDKKIQGAYMNKTTELNEGIAGDTVDSEAHYGSDLTPREQRSKYRNRNEDRGDGQYD